MEMHNFIEIMIDEFGCDKNEAEKALNYANEKMKEVSPDLCLPEQIDEYLGKFEIEQEKKNFLKEKIFLSTLPPLKKKKYSEKEFNFRKSTKLPKKFFAIRITAE